MNAVQVGSLAEVIELRVTTCQATFYKQNSTH